MHFYCVDDAVHKPVWCLDLKQVKQTIDRHNPAAPRLNRDDVVVFLFDLNTGKQSIANLLNGVPLFAEQRAGAVDLRLMALRYWMIGPRGGLKEVDRAYYLENLA